MPKRKSPHERKYPKMVFLPLDLLDWVKGEAIDRSISESQVIADAVMKAADLMLVPFVRPWSRSSGAVSGSGDLQK